MNLAETVLMDFPVVMDVLVPEVNLAELDQRVIVVHLDHLDHLEAVVSMVYLVPKE